MQLKNIHTIEAVIVCETGLHIGAGDVEMHIGGIDNSVVKNPLTGEPYIPGSSLKGRMRSLLEWRSGDVQSGPLGWKDYERTKNEEVLAILKLFGVGGGDQLTLEEAKCLGPTRLSFWDAPLDPTWAEEQREAHRMLTEAKSENTIDRITSVAANPRQTERVPAGARFKFRAAMKDLGDGDDLLKLFLIGLKLIELDGLGGSSSRGYGKIRFESLTVDGEDAAGRLAATQPFARL